MSVLGRPMFRRRYDNGGVVLEDNPITTSVAVPAARTDLAGLKAALAAIDQESPDTGPRMPSGAALRAMGASLMQGGRNPYNTTSGTFSEIGAGLQAANAAQMKGDAADAALSEARKTRQAANLRAFYSADATLAGVRSKASRLSSSKNLEKKENLVEKILETENVFGINMLENYMRSVGNKVSRSKIAELMNILGKANINKTETAESTEREKQLTNIMEQIVETGHPESDNAAKLLMNRIKIDPDGDQLDAPPEDPRSDFEASKLALLEIYGKSKAWKEAKDRADVGVKMKAAFGSMPQRANGDRITANNATPEEYDNARKMVQASTVSASRAQGEGAAMIKESIAFKEQYVRVYDAVGKLKEIKGIVGKAPASFGTVGNLSSVFASIVSQLGGAKSIFESEKGESETRLIGTVARYMRGQKGEKKSYQNRNFDKVTKRFDSVIDGLGYGRISNKMLKAGKTNRYLKGAILSAAISLASIESVRTKGRLTNVMIEQKIKELAGQGNIHDALIDSVDRIGSSLVKRLKLRHQVMGGKISDMPIINWKSGIEGRAQTINKDGQYNGGPKIIKVERRNK